jgi:hypothetical protein
MKIVKERSLAVISIFLIGFTVVPLLCLAVALRPLMQEGFWPGLGGLLICLGALLFGTGIAAQIARTPRPGESRFVDHVGLIFSDPFGLVCLVTLAGRYSVLLGGAVIVCWMPFVVLTLQELFHAPEHENDKFRAERSIGNSREQGAYAYRD